MMNLRTFTKSGTEEFHDYLFSLKEGKFRIKPDLNISRFSEEFYIPVEIDENIKFNTRFELAKYLDDLLTNRNIKRSTILKNDNVWNWLSFIWIEQLTNGFRELREIRRYILTSGISYRHIVFCSYDLFTLCGEKYSKLFLYTPVNKVSEFIDKFVGKYRWVSNITLVEILYNLYYDKVKNKPKQACSHRGTPGNIYRLIKVLNQIELNYDIYSMESAKIMSFLPKEFEQWKKN